MKDIEDEIPFDVPEGWCWCRLTNVAITELGKTLDAKKNKGKLYDYLCALNVKWYSFDFTTLKQIRLEEKEKERYLVRKGDLLICEGGDVGRAAIWESENPIYYQNALHRVRFYQNINQYFFLHVLNYYKNLGIIDDVSGGVTIKHFTQNSMQKLLFPLPPLAEQERIASSIDNIFTQIGMVDQYKSELQTVLRQTKSKILDLAIHGKLVPQNPDDEPAEELLKRIATSDNRPYKKFEEEIPFDIPESWAWSSMKDIVTINPKNKLDDNLQVSFIPMTLIDAEYKNTHGQEERLWKDIKKGFTHFAENDVAIAKISPCFENRKSVVLKNLKNGFGAGTTELYILRSSGAVLPEYIMWLAKSDNFINTGVGNFSGVVGQQRLARDIVEDYPVPLPPLTEQQRIVTKIEELFSYLDTISSSLE